MRRERLRKLLTPLQSIPIERDDSLPTSNPARGTVALLRSQVVRQANRTLPRHPMEALAASCFNEILLQLRYKDQRDAVSYAGILRARQFSSKEVASDSEAHLVSGRIVSGLSREILFDVLRAMQGGPTMASGKRGRLLRRFYQGLPRRDRGPISSQPKPMEVATG